MFFQILSINFFLLIHSQTFVVNAFKLHSFQDNGVIRIVNGEDATDGEFPWQVGIMGSSATIPRYLCGGALISSEWVLTAGHCVIGARSAEIYSGSTKISSRNKTTSVAAEFIVHEDFDETYLTNDIGLIRLEKPVDINNFTKPIDLAENELKPNTIVKVSGWGSISDADPNPYSDNLKFINVSIISNTECAAYYGNTIISSGVVCTSTGSGEVKSPCLGDSGAPVIAIIEDRPVHVATFSFVYAYSCELPFPAGNSRTSFYREWITEHTGI